jgi:cytidyltransferase-like protein
MPERKQTIAVVPGAFKPPHQGHADMVQKYADKADKVIILISKPTVAGRYLDPVDKKSEKTEILQSHSEQIWRDVFLPQISGAEIEIDTESDYANPIQAAYDYIGINGPLDPKEWRVILGASDKPDDNGIPDWHRWKGAHKYKKPGLELMDIEENAVSCTDRACGIPFSATTMRELISALRKEPNHPTARKELSEFIPDDRINDLLAIFGESKVEETSAAAGGAVAGYSGPLSSSGKTRKRKKQPSMIREQKIDLTLIDEVMELLIERGIVA